MRLSLLRLLPALAHMQANGVLRTSVSKQTSVRFSSSLCLTEAKKSSESEALETTDTRKSRIDSVLGHSVGYERYEKVDSGQMMLLIGEMSTMNRRMDSMEQQQKKNDWRNSKPMILLTVCGSILAVADPLRSFFEQSKPHTQGGGTEGAAGAPPSQWTVVHDRFRNDKNNLKKGRAVTILNDGKSMRMGGSETFWQLPWALGTETFKRDQGCSKVRWTVLVEKSGGEYWSLGISNVASTTVEGYGWNMGYANYSDGNGVFVNGEYKAHHPGWDSKVEYRNTGTLATVTLDLETGVLTLEVNGKEVSRIEGVLLGQTYCFFVHGGKNAQFALVKVEKL